jgi:hypothetical protein
MREPVTIIVFLVIMFIVAAAYLGQDANTLINGVLDLR